jgi:guanylate kinase
MSAPVTGSASSSAPAPAPAPGHVFVIAAPSGTGKTTICRRILEADPALMVSTSHTTRSPRTGEVDGRDYHFVDEQSFRAIREADGFLEHAEYNGNLYGTSWAAIKAPLEEGNDVVLEIEVQGARQVRDRMPEACLIFLLPPSLRVLEKRLRSRATDAESVIQRRMALVDRELEAAEIFDFAVINDDLDRAVDEVLYVIHAVREAREQEAVVRHGREGVMTNWRLAQAAEG